MQPILAAATPEHPADAPAGATGADTPAPAFTALLAQKMQADAAAATPATAPASPVHQTPADEGAASQDATPSASATASETAGTEGTSSGAAGAAAPAPESTTAAALWRAVRAFAGRMSATTVAAPTPQAQVHLTANDGEAASPTIAVAALAAAGEGAAGTQGTDVPQDATPASAATPAMVVAATSVATPSRPAGAANGASTAAPTVPDPAATAATPIMPPRAHPSAIVEPPGARPDAGAAAARGETRRERVSDDARTDAKASVTTPVGSRAADAPGAPQVPPALAAALAAAAAAAATMSEAAVPLESGDAPAAPGSDAPAIGSAQAASAAVLAMTSAATAASMTSTSPAPSRRGIDGEAAPARGGPRSDTDGSERRASAGVPTANVASAPTDGTPNVVPAAVRSVVNDARSIDVLGGSARVTGLVVEREAQLTIPRTPVGDGHEVPAPRATGAHRAGADGAAPAAAPAEAAVNSLAELDAPTRRLAGALDEARSGTRAPLPTREAWASDVPSPAAPRARSPSTSRILADSRDEAAPRASREAPVPAAETARPEASAHTAAASARAAQAAADAAMPAAAARTSPAPVAASRAPIAGTAEAPAAPLPLATDRITVKLGDEAGAPSIRVAIRGDRVEARIVTSDGALARSLDTGSHELSASLQAQGFGESRVQVRGTPSALEGAGLANLAGSAPTKASDAGAQQGEGERRSPEQRHQGRFEDRPRHQHGRDGKRRLDEEER